MRLRPGPGGPSRRRVRWLDLALAAATAAVYLAARRRRLEISDLERQPVGAPERERLDIPPELDAP